MKNFIFSLALVFAVPAHAAEVLYVAPGGSDAWSGRLEKPNKAKTDGPLASPQGARDAARKLKAVETNGIIVQFLPGTYQMTAPLTLDAQDANVEWRGLDKNTRISGGRAVGGWTPVTDAAILARLPENARGSVRQTGLTAQGITEFGKLARRGFSKPVVESHLELFWNDQPMTLARWPNAGEKQPYARVAALPGGQDGLTFGADENTAPRLQKWAQESDPWLFGYWFHDWADEYIPAAKIDAAAKTLTIPDPKPAFGLKLKQRFYALNMLSELDEAGEYYLDRASGILYFWPPSAVGAAYVSIAPSLLNIQNSVNIRFSHLTFEGTRGTAVSVRDSKQVVFSSCVLRNLGNAAINVNGGERCLIAGNDIYNCGDGGVNLSGGDRKTLARCDHEASNNHIWNFSRWSRTYRPAVGVNGVGVSVSHNLLHDGPHDAIQLGGNDHLIEYNEVHSVAYDTGDVGAFYMGRDWTARGTVIRHNYFHHVQGPGTYGAMGVYLDDQASGITMSGNLFYKVSRAVFIGGGDDNLVDNNIFVDCVPSVHIDARGMGWQKPATDDLKGELRTRLNAMPYQNDLWKTRYPLLLNVLEDNPNAPKRNLVQHNIAVGGKWDDVEKKGAEWQIFKDNFVTADPRYKAGLPAAPRAVDFKALNKTNGLVNGFQAIPLELIGLRKMGAGGKGDQRATWPVVHAPRVMPQDEESVEKAASVVKGLAPVFKVAKAQAVPAVDGAINAAEWNGANVKDALLLEQNYDGAKAKPTSLAWIEHSQAGLWLAIDNATDPNATLRKGDTWGEDDAVEIAIRLETFRLDSLSRVATVYRGFPSGNWHVSDENGLPNDLVNAAKIGVKYAARAVEQGRWTAEWFLPWSSLGLNGAPAPGTRFAFNLTARKPAGDLWLMWRGTQGNSFLVERAGVLEIAGP